MKIIINEHFVITEQQIHQIHHFRCNDEVQVGHVNYEIKQNNVQQVDEHHHRHHRHHDEVDDETDDDETDDETDDIVEIE